MIREIKESDWKVFRRLRAIALYRFCERVLEEIRLAATDAKDGYHECYLKVYPLIETCDKTIVRTFDDPTVYGSYPACEHDRRMLNSRR